MTDYPENYYHPKVLDEGDEASYAAYEAREGEPEALRALPLPREHSGYRVYGILGFGNLVLPNVETYYEKTNEGATILPVHPGAAFVLDREPGNPNIPNSGGGWTLLSLVDLYGFSLMDPVEIHLADLRVSAPLCKRFKTLVWNIMRGTPGQAPQEHPNPNHDPKDPRTGPAVLNIPGRPHGEPLVSRFSKVMEEAEKRAAHWEEQRSMSFVDSGLILPQGARGEKREIVTAPAGSLPELPPQ